MPICISGHKKVIKCNIKIGLYRIKQNQNILPFKNIWLFFDFSNVAMYCDNIFTHFSTNLLDHPTNSLVIIKIIITVSVNVNLPQAISIHTIVFQMLKNNYVCYP